MKRLILLSVLIGLKICMYAQPKPDQIKNLKFRPIGPAIMGGRITDIIGIPDDPATFYFAAADGGLFKTTNGDDTY